MARKRTRNPTVSFKARLDNLGLYVQSRQVREDNDILGVRTTSAAAAPSPSADAPQEHVLLGEEDEGAAGSCFFSFIGDEEPQSLTSTTTTIDNDDEDKEEFVYPNALIEDFNNNELDDMDFQLLVSAGGRSTAAPTICAGAVTEEEPARPAVATATTTRAAEYDQSSNFSDRSIPSAKSLLNATYLGLAEIHQLALESGVSLEFVDKVLRIIRKHSKHGFDVNKAPLRSTFFKNVRLMLGSNAPPLPTIAKFETGAAGETLLPKFSLLDQIRDLISSEVFQNVDNLVLANPNDPSTIYDKYLPPDDQNLLEVHSGQWYVSTYDLLVQDPAQDWMFPLIFYIDKTGTDAMQRYPLEPLMVTTSLLKRETREQATAWRHLGFVPPCDDAGATPEAVMQYFHQCLDVLLADLVSMQESPPILEVTIGGITTRRRLLLPVAFVMGDQLSQDKLCGRKAINSGGAAKIHRRCMCSSLSASSTADVCVQVKKKDIDKLLEVANQTIDHMEWVVNTDIPLLPSTVGAARKKVIQQRKTRLSYLQRRSKFARLSLERVYSMYPIDNAWTNVCFGSNQNGIYRASLDDPMHYCDSGSFLYLSQVAFLSMTQSERGEMEEIIKSYFKGKRSSIRDDMPRGKFSSGFSRTTLLTAGEKIGLIMSLYMALGTEKGAALYTTVIARNQERYDFKPSDKNGSYTLPKRGDVHFFADLNQKNSIGTNGSRPLKRTLNGVEELVQNMSQHEVSFMLVDKDFDDLQTEYLLQTVHNLLGPHTSPQGGLHPRQARGGLSVEERSHAKRLFNKLRKEPQTSVLLPPLLVKQKYDDVLKSSNDEDHDHDEVVVGGQQTSNKKRKTGPKQQVYVVRKQIKKHCLVRPKVKGSGTSYAILTNLEGFRDVLMQALCFHSFVHYFDDISSEKRANHDFIERSVRRFIKNFSECIYRGDDSVDCDTCKIHSHLHLATDIQEYGHPMNWEAGKGERGLKVWAKIASATAQKVRLPVFTYQTALRVADAALLSTALRQLVPVVSTTSRSSDTTTDGLPSALTTGSSHEEPTTRKKPHFLLDLISGRITVVPIRGPDNIVVAVDKNPFNAKVITFLETVEGVASNEPIEIWKDATLTRIHGGPKMVRACSCYDEFGQFFDWVSVQFDSAEDASCYPAKLLMIYKDREGDLSAIVHGCEWRNVKEKRLSTPLASRWSLEYHPSTGSPTLRKIKLNAIVEILYVIEHAGENPKGLGINVPAARNNKVAHRRYSVDVIEPRYMWAGKFLLKQGK